MTTAPVQPKVTHAEREPFGFACVDGALRGALVGVPAGVVAFVLVAPFQTHTWPGELDSSLRSGSVFGLGAGVTLGAGLGASGCSRRRWLRQVGRAATGLLALAVAAVLCAADSQVQDGKLPDPSGTVRVLGRGGPRGFPTDLCLVTAFALSGSLVAGGLRLEKVPDSRSVTLLLIALGFTALQWVANRWRLEVICFALVLVALVRAGLWFTDPVSRWVRAALGQPDSTANT